MKKFTLEDLNTFEMDENGFLQCPTGDYSDIKEFPKYCDFGSGSVIGPYSTIGAYSRIGEDSRIGEGSRMGVGSRIGEDSRIGEGSRMGVGSRIGAYSIIGEDSRIGEGSRIGEDSIIGVGSRMGQRISINEGVIMESGCYIEDDKPLKQYFLIQGCGRERRKTHFFLLTDNRIYIRCGCFAGYEDEFIEKVHETHKGNLYEKQYFAALELAKLTFQEERDKAGESKNEGQG